MIRLNKEAYSKLIEQDILYLRMQDNCLEQSHIIEVLKHSIELMYPEDKLVKTMTIDGQCPYCGSNDITKIHIVNKISHAWECNNCDENFQDNKIEHSNIIRDSSGDF